MARNITVAALTAASAANVRPVSFVRLAYDSGTIFVSSAAMDFTFNSETYLGLGNVGSITSIEESAEVKANGMALTISGVPSDFISDSLNEDYQGRDARVYLGFLDDNLQLIADPMLAFRGRMDTQDISLGQTATISLTLESRLIDWDRPRIRRYTNEDQQNEYPSDKGLEFVSQMVEKEINWPGKAA